MTAPIRDTALEGELFDITQGVDLASVLRNVDLAALEGEIRLHVDEVNDRVRKLDQAQVVSQELLDTVISV